MNTKSELNPPAPNFSGIPAVPSCPTTACENTEPTVQPVARAVPEWLDIIAKIAAPVVVIVVAAGLYNLVPELVRGTKESFNRVAAQVDFKGNLSHELCTAFR